MKYWYLLLIGLFISTESWAKIEYEVTVPVDVEAENSVAAKDKAMLQAQRQAFLQTAGQLTSEENVQKLGELSDDAIMHFIEAVSVADEKAGGTKYIANLTVQINEQLLKDYMAENEMIKAEGAEMVVIPVFKPSVEAYPVLWEDNNVWLKSWRSKGLIKFGTMQMRTLTDNYRQIDDFSAQNALYMGADLYTAVSQRSGSDRVYVVFADTMRNGDLKVTIKNEKAKTEDSFTVYNDGQGDIFDKAIEKSVMFISNMERTAKNSDQTVSVNSLSAVYGYQNMKDWLIKSKAIADLEQVEGIETKSFGGGKVNFSIRYTGDIEDLWSALQEIGFSHEASGNYFIIR